MPEGLIVSVGLDARGFESPFDEACIAANPHVLAAALTDADSAAGGPLAILRCTDDAGAPLAVWTFAQKTIMPGIAVLSAPPVPRYNLYGSPLIGVRGSAACIPAMLDHLRAVHAGPRILSIKNLPAEGAAWLALKEMAAAGRIGISIISRWERAILERSIAADADACLSVTISSSRRKRLRKNRQALERIGALTLTAHTGEDAAIGFETCLRVEASGWKGRAGTALSQKPADSAYVGRVMQAMAAENRGWVLEMRSGEQVAAAGLILRCGGEASFWKTAYDEAQARYSPGVILDMMVTEWLYDQPWFVRLDSGADDTIDPDSQIWKQRRAMVNAVISLDPGSLPERLVVSALRLRHRARALKHRYLDR